MKGKIRPAGLASRDSLRAWILNKEIILETREDKREKYGGLLGVILLGTENINNKLIEKGIAKNYIKD